MNRIAPTLLLSLLVGACDDADTVPTGPSPLVAARVTPLNAYPAGVLRTGSSVSISARVTDATGTNIVDGLVTWRTTSGTLSATSTTTDRAGYTTVTLTGREAATVTAAIGGLPDLSIAVPAFDPFRVALQVQTTNPTTAAPVSVTVSTATTSDVPNAPAPTSVVVDCGNNEVLTPGIGGVVSCRYAEPGRYVVSGRASVSDFTAAATVAVVVSSPPAPPEPPPPPVSPPAVPGLTLTATELHRGTGSATWRFRVTAVGGERRGELDWFFDYIDAPGSGAEPARLTDDDEFEDVTYRARGTKQVSVRGNVSGTEVVATATITVAF